MSDHRGQPQRIGDAWFPTCASTGKIRHPTEAEAKDHQAQLLTWDGGRKGVFRCPTCQGWHVGGGARGAGKRKRRR